MTQLRLQHGVVTRRQFLELEGVTRSALQRSTLAGWMIPLTTNTLRIASAPESFHARCQAVSLEVSDVGFLSGQTAARLYGLRQMRADDLEVMIPHGGNLTLPHWGIVRRTSWYSAVDRNAERTDLAVACPLRMLFSLAARFNQYRFERAAEDAWHLQLVSPDEAHQYLEAHRCRGKDGVRRMEIWLERALPRERPAQSGLELDLLEAIARIGLPTPARQHPVTLIDGEVVHIDIAWPKIRLGIEPGAMWWHGGDGGQRRDQARDIACGEVGWQIYRFDDQLRANPIAAARRVERLYRTRSADISHNIVA